MRDLLNLPADTPARDVWAELWKLGFDVAYPQPHQTAAEWLAGLNLTSSQWKLINYRAQEATPHE